MKFAANRARFRGLTACVARFPIVGNRSPEFPAPPRKFPGISGIPPLSEIRQISRIAAASDPAHRNGSPVLGSRAPRGSNLGRCDWRQTGPLPGNIGLGSSVFRASRLWLPPQATPCRYHLTLPPAARLRRGPRFGVSSAGQDSAGGGARHALPAPRTPLDANRGRQGGGRPAARPGAGRVGGSPGPLGATAGRGTRIGKISLARRPPAALLLPPGCPLPTAP